MKAVVQPAVTDPVTARAGEGSDLITRIQNIFAKDAEQDTKDWKRQQ
jgi:hypothetical protein